MLAPTGCGDGGGKTDGTAASSAGSFACLLPPHAAAILHSDIVRHMERSEVARAAFAPVMDRARRLVCRAVAELWPTARVDTYGSAATLLDLPSSDLDLRVVGVRGDARSIARLLTPLALHDDIVETFRPIATASVPVLKLTLRSAHGRKLPVDITFADTDDSSDAVTFVIKCSQALAALAPIVLVVKQLLVDSDQKDSYRGGLGSYSLTLLVVAYLQLTNEELLRHNGLFGHPQLLQSSLASLLLGFLDYYADFPAHEYGISIHLDVPQIGSHALLSLPAPRAHTDPFYHAATSPSTSCASWRVFFLVDTFFFSVLVGRREYSNWTQSPMYFRPSVWSFAIPLARAQTSPSRCLRLRPCSRRFVRVRSACGIRRCPTLCGYLCSPAPIECSVP